MNRAVPTWAKVALGLILIFCVWWRGHTIGPTIKAGLGSAPYPVVSGEAEPIDCDEAVFAYIGRGLARGKILYRDYSDNKPPLGYWIYTVAVAVGGATELTVRLVSVPFVLATVGLVGWIGFRVGGAVAGCFASFVLVLLSTDPYLFGNGSNMEHFINFFAVGSLGSVLAWLARPGKVGRDRWWLVLAGVLVGLASLVKQVAAVQGFVYALTALLANRRPMSVSARIKAVGLDGLALLAGFAAPWVLAFGLLWVQGAGPDAVEDVFRYGSALASIKVADPHSPPLLIRWFTGNADPNGMLPPPFGKTRYLVWWGLGSWPVWVASLPCLASMLAGPRSGGSRRLIAAWTIAAWVEVALPGLFWQHYYLLPTPGIALAVGLTVGRLGDLLRGGPKAGRVAPVLAGLALLGSVGWMIRIQVRDYLMVPAEQLTARYKGGQQWIALRSIGRDLGRRSRNVWPEPSLYVWGWQSPLFVYSGLDGPTRHFFADPLLEDYSRGHHRGDPRVEPRADRIIRDLATQPPSIAFVAYPPFTPLRKFLEAGYVRSSLLGMDPNSPDGLGLWVDRDHYRAFEASAKEPTR